jgi:hypothetical protein
MNICKKNKIDIKEKYEIGLVKTSGQHLNKRLLTHFSKNDLIRIRDNLTKKFKKRLIGRLEIIGSPQIRLNDGVRLHNIQIEKFEIDKIIFKVVRVEHLFNMLNGYVTRIYLEELLQ